MIRACVAVISGGLGFMRGVCVQKMFLQKLMPSYRHILLVEHLSYTTAQLDYLRRIGWEVRLVEPLRTQKTNFAAARWPRTFTKLQLWSQTDLDYIVYLDADACPFKSYPELFGLEFDTVAATRVRPEDPKRFNSGVMSLKPSEETFLNILEWIKKKPEDNGAKLADQGLLNLMYAGKFHDLPDKYNQRKWNKKSADTVIAHIRPVPWKRSRHPVALRPYVKEWRQQEDACVREHGAFIHSSSAD